MWQRPFRGVSGSTWQNNSETTIWRWQHEKGPWNQISSPEFTGSGGVFCAALLCGDLLRDDQQLKPERVCLPRQYHFRLKERSLFAGGEEHLHLLGDGSSAGGGAVIASRDGIDAEGVL